MPLPKGTKKSDADRAAQNKYAAKNLAVVACKIRRSDADAFRLLCAANGCTINAGLTAYVQHCLDSQTLDYLPETSSAQRPALED